MVKFLSYIVATVLFGMGQVVTIASILSYKSEYFTLETLLKDGGTYFFATSLTFTNIFTLWNRKTLSDFDKFLSLAIIAIMIYFGLVGYTTGYLDGFNKNINFDFVGRHFWGQIICFSVSLMFALYIEATNGSFKNNKYV